ncbi:MAG: hypothetical protein JNM47_03845 [Hyphomonadaceae bacterium]|nr:hypothetical protein [Hyphomonadaceae bacterium]
MNKMLGMAVAVALSAAATISFAQTTPATPPVEPPATTVPAPAPDAATPPAATQPATPAPPVETAEAAPAATTATAGSCRTRKAEGDACACLKDPDTVGVAQSAPNGGRNICVVQ